MYKFLCVSVNARDPADTRLNRKWQVFWLYPYPTRLPGQSSSDLVCRSCKKGLTASGNVADSHCIPVLAPTRALLNACIFNENAAWIWTVKNQMRCKDIKNYWTNQKKQEKNLKHLHYPIQYPIFLHIILSHLSSHPYAPLYRFCPISLVYFCKNAWFSNRNTQERRRY